MRRFMEGRLLSSHTKAGRVRRAVSIAAALLSAVCLLGLGAAAPAAPTPTPSLAVVISVDGLSWDRLQYYRPWYVSGLKRLLDESRLETETRYRHLNTETGPGHASLSTGAPPRVSGVVGNRWFELQPDGSLRGLNCVERPAPEGPPGNAADVLPRGREERPDLRLRPVGGARGLGRLGRGGPRPHAPRLRAQGRDGGVRLRRRARPLQHEARAPLRSASPDDTYGAGAGRLARAHPWRRPCRTPAGSPSGFALRQGPFGDFHGRPPGDPRRLLVRPGQRPLRHLTVLRAARTA